METPEKRRGKHHTNMCWDWIQLYGLGALTIQCPIQFQLMELVLSRIPSHQDFFMPDRIIE
jgi:hypothetical protein